MPPLNARALSDRPGRAADLLREWAQACMATGARGGLSLLLDEADVDYGNRWRTANEREQRAGLLAALRQMADAGPRAGSYARLVIALAITPNALEPDPVGELKAALGRHLETVVLRELSDAQMRTVGDGVCRLYRVAYDLPDSETTRTSELVSEALAAQSEDAEQRNPRKFIRRLLEKLDAVHV
jgi:hypothetical protein